MWFNVGQNPFDHKEVTNLCCFYFTYFNFFCACLLAPVSGRKFTDDTSRVFLFIQFYHLSLVPIIPVSSPVKVYSIMLQYVRIVFSCCVTQCMTSMPLTDLNSGLYWNISCWKAVSCIHSWVSCSHAVTKFAVEVIFWCWQKNNVNFTCSRSSSMWLSA